jgi:hypothetical protein
VKLDQPKKLDFISALKATNAAEEPKRSHTQPFKESIGVAAAPESIGYNVTTQLVT